ncbi:hypothetical protein [Acrocarpospora catenulata]|nr:hypothetical protein [Acrocarpospora catenulata]
MALPLNLLPCPVTGDIILVPVGTVHMRLDPEQQRELAAELLARAAAA